MKEGWKIYQLGELVSFDKRFKGIDRTKQKNIVTFNHVSAELLKSLSVEGGEVKLLATGLFDGYTTIEKAGKNLNNGEVITIPTGGNANIKYYKGLFVDSGNILAVSNREDIYLKYVWYYLIYQNEFLESCYKGTSIKHPYMPDIWELEVPIPSLSEQERIVSYIDAEFAKIDALKANIEQQLQASKDLFQSALKEMLTPKEGWIKEKLGDLYDVRDGTHESPKYHDVGYPLVTSKNLKGGYIDMENVKLISEKDYTRINERSKVNVGDVLFAMIGTIGNATIVETEPNYAIKNMALFKIPSNQSGRFLKYMLDSKFVLDGMLSKSKGTSQPFVSLGILRSFEIYLPSLKEQREIAAILDSLSAKVKALQENYNKALVLCNDLKQSLLKSIFE